MKRRILHLITQLPVGGAEQLLADVVSHLDPNRYESVVCCIQHGGPIADRLLAAGKKVIPLGLMPRGGYDSHVVAALRQLLEAERIDLVHSHLYHANLYGRIAAWRNRLPAIASVHNTYSQTKWHRQLINCALARVSAAVVAVSEDIRADIARFDHVPKNKLIVIPNGIDTARLASSLAQSEAKQRLGFANNELVVGCVGRLEEQKGHAFLLRAAAELRPHYPCLRFALVGDGRKRKELEAMVRQLRIDDIVRFLGVRKDMADVLRAFDIYAMPSLWEGLSLAMLEAMAAGLPVIISDVGGAAEVLGDNIYGYRIPPGDVSALSHAVVKLVDDPTLRHELGDKARQRVTTEYEIGVMLRRLEALYARVLDDKDKEGVAQ